MARDDELSSRIRAALAHVPNVTEKRMFGSIAFMVRARCASAGVLSESCAASTPHSTMLPWNEQAAGPWL